MTVDTFAGGTDGMARGRAGQTTVGAASWIRIFMTAVAAGMGYIINISIGLAMTVVTVIALEGRLYRSC